jgi:hypothetical protein
LSTLSSRLNCHLTFFLNCHCLQKAIELILFVLILLLLLPFISIEFNWYTRTCLYLCEVTPQCKNRKSNQQTYPLWLGNRRNIGHEYIRRLSLTFTLLCPINGYDKFNMQLQFELSDCLRQTDTILINISIF